MQVMQVMPRNCSMDIRTGQTNSSGPVIPQTLFLGASVLSYSVNMGWGGQPGSLTVELINDSQPVQCTTNGITSAFGEPPNPGYGDNHYYTCVGDACYVNESGTAYNSMMIPPPREKRLPGKVYYNWTPQGIVSKYWTKEDPGFFADYTKISLNGQYFPNVYTSYDIIGIPVVFVLDDFIFAGIVQSWEKNIRGGQTTYTVNIEGPDNILNNSWMILKDYTGSVFSKLNAGSLWGGPLSYTWTHTSTAPRVVNKGKIQEGNLHNTFNVYGFLESFAINSFGGANLSDEGLAYSDVLDAITVLTSTEPVVLLNINEKNAFSPFGRILGKCIQEAGSLTSPAPGVILGFGTFPVEADLMQNGTPAAPRTFFTLDLSELPRPDKTFKISGSVVSIGDFIRQLTAVMGVDYYTELIPGVVNAKPHNIIKVKVIDRRSQPPLNQISDTIQSLQEAGYGVEINGIGKQINDSSVSRTMYIGGKQERLLQAKNYRLGFKQTSYIYNPAIDRLVDFRLFDGQKLINKIREPVAYSIRNPQLSVNVNGEFATAIFDQAETIHRTLNQVNWDVPDAVWADIEVGGTMGPESVRAGNYAKSKEAKTFLTDPPTNRYIPIYMDTICPFFGYISDDSIQISTDGGSNNFRKIRPVWLDSWTGQIVIICDTDELPPITLGTSSLLRTSSITSFFERNKFFITETEMRAAMDGFDSYLTYCHAKSVATKPHLYLMLMSAYYHASPAYANQQAVITPGIGGGWTVPTPFTPLPFTPPENVFIHQGNAANANGLPQVNDNGGGAAPQSPLSWSSLIDPNFIKDLMTLCEFVANLGNRFYGQKYMVRIGDIPLYQDRTYSSFDIPGGTYTGHPDAGKKIAVFAGTGKIFYSREPCESAWEEYGNVIDDSFVVGSEAWWAIINENGKIPPLLGYNATDSYDWEGRRLCGLKVIAASLRFTTRDTIRILMGQTGINNIPGLPRAMGLSSNDQLSFSSYLSQYQKIGDTEVLQHDTSYGNMVRFFLTAQGVCDDKKFIFPSLNLGNLNTNDFVLMKTLSARKDAFGVITSAGVGPPDIRPPILTPDLRLKPFRTTDGMSKKLFLKSQIEGMGFMDSVKLKDARVILSCPGIKLNPPSLNFAVDPTRTVLCNAALEDLIVYLKSVVPGTPNYSPAYINHLLTLIRGYDIFANTSIDPAGSNVVRLIGNRPVYTAWPNMGYNTNVSKQHQTIVPKAAHPYFAAVPVRSNQYCYGPWVNYPKLVSQSIFLPAAQTQLGLLTRRLQNVTTGLGRAQGILALNPNNDEYRNLVKSLNRELKIITDFIGKFGAGIQKIVNGDAVENMLTGVTIDVNEDLVPWNYGGMPFLDKAVLSLIQSNTDYQQILETAQITISSTPIFGLGGEFIFQTRRTAPGGSQFYYNNELYQTITDMLEYKDAKLPEAPPPLVVPIPGNPVYLPSSVVQPVVIPIQYPIIIIKSLNRTNIAPIVTNISTRFDNTGATTTYSFKTYSRKLGLFAKENADRLKKANENNIKFNRNLFLLKNSLITGSISRLQREFIDNQGSRPAYSTKDLQTKLFGTSPTEVLIGSAQGFLPSKSTMQAQLGLAFPSIDYINNTFTIAPRPLVLTGKDPGDSGINHQDIKSIMAKYRYRSWVGMFQQSETKAELEQGYEEKAAMSLDGLFSPVSFYPTISNATYPMLPYPRIAGKPICPKCRGDGFIIDGFAIGEGNAATQATTIGDYACPACSKGMPSIVIDENSVSGVNAMNLQPIVVPYAVWRNAHAQPANSGERQRHSIRIIGRNWTPPFDVTNGISLDIDKNKEILKDPTTNKIVENGQGFNIDFHPNDMAKFIQTGGYYPNNQRFFAWRGPLMMHGWGYDVSGFPVPNAADEPKEIDAQGRPKRFKLTSSGTNDYATDGAFVVAGTQYGLGDVMGKGWEMQNGKWTRKPSQYFYLNWAERPDLWPVGPIDLRWDYNRRVWTAGSPECSGDELPPFIVTDINDPSGLAKFSTLEKGKCPYKPIYVTLEEDMIKEQYYDETYPVRAFIDDIQYSKEPLPNRVRRLVFVKDRAGYTAPRGAKLLCRYDNNTGFYEPISKQTYFVFGTITGGNNAIVDLSYIQGKHRSSTSPTMSIIFDNTRFQFDIIANSKGMFYYENGTWILVSTKQAPPAPPSS